MFAAFPYLSIADFRRTAFDTVPEGQSYLFTQVSKRLLRLENQYRGSVHVIQAALLLSFWNPYDSSKHVNIFWVDRAVSHALQARLKHSKYADHHIIWWCCVVATRTMALGLRRFQKLTILETPALPQLYYFRGMSR